MKYLAGCCEWEFDSIYPIQLNGIIRQEEFVESTENLNRAINSKKDSIICWVLVIVCLVLGSILFIVGGILANVSDSTFFSIMVAIGIGVCVVGCLIICCCSYIIQSKVDNRLRQAVRQESQKYSNSNPVPCSWRLDSTRGLHSSYFGCRNRRPPYHVSSISFYCKYLSILNKNDHI